MSASITFTLPDDVKQAVDDVAQQEGITPDQVIEDAVKKHLFLRRFRSLRDRLAAKAQQQGIRTDEDVFDRVS